MSRAAYVLNNARNGFKMGDQKVVDTMINDGLRCAMNDFHMGNTAENLVQNTKFHVMNRMNFLHGVTKSSSCNRIKSIC